MSDNEKTADAIVGLHQPLLLLYGIEHFIADDLLCAVGEKDHLSVFDSLLSVLGT